IAKYPPGPAYNRVLARRSFPPRPEPHAPFLRLRGDRRVRLRCHTGHAFTADTLLAELNEATENAVWTAVRSMQEGAMLLTHLADHWDAIDPDTASRYRLKAKRALKRADTIRHSTVDEEPVGQPRVPQ